MAEGRKSTSKAERTSQGKRRPPARSDEAREKRLVSMAMDEAERQIKAGTASSQILTHFLKLGTEQAKLERVKLEHENQLLIAKTEALQSQKRVDELYAQAIDAMKSYSGVSSND